MSSTSNQNSTSIPSNQTLPASSDQVPSHPALVATSFIPTSNQLPTTSPNPNSTTTPVTFVPNPVALKQLKDMGFQEEDVIAALKATNNNQELACGWLLGEREESNWVTDDEEEEEEPTEDGRLLQQILSNPIIQTHISNPRVVLAIHSLLENPGAAQNLIHDPEIGPVLREVSQILTNTRNQQQQSQQSQQQQ